MDIKNKIIEGLKDASLEEVLDLKNTGSLDWFWINRDIFPDILKNISQFDYYAEEESIQEVLSKMKEEEFIEPLREEINKKDFLEISQEVFGRLDKEYRRIEDIKTWIFVNRVYYNKLWINKSRELEWTLMAMGIDTYQRLDFSYTTLEETYRDLFEDNNRIIEGLVEKGTFVLESGKWILNKEENVLIFYKNGRVFYEWGKGEAYSKFDELSSP